MRPPDRVLLTADSHSYSPDGISRPGVRIPFNAVTTIEYSIPQTESVRIELFNVPGRRVAILVDESLSAGRYRVRFDGSMLGSGVYLYRMAAGPFVEVKSLILVK